MVKVVKVHVVVAVVVVASLGMCACMGLIGEINEPM